MAAYNPCYCWNLKDGCITVGIWSLIWSLIEVGLFCWQTWIIQWKRSLFENRRGRIYSANNAFENQPGQIDWTQYYQSPEEFFFFRIFIIQILNLIAAFFLLFASAALIYGIHTSSKHMVWPWFPCMVCSILCSGAYCIMWWAGNVESYWLVLTIVEFLAILINLYCLLCVIVQYRRIVKGYTQSIYDDDYKPKQLVYEYRPRDQAIKGDEYYGEKQKAVDGYHNETYETTEPVDLNSKNKVYLYKGGVMDQNAYEQEQKQQTQQTQTPLPQYQPFQVQYYPMPLPQAQQLPVKTQPPPEPEFKERFTEAWVKGVTQAPPGEPPNQQGVSAHSSPDRRQQRFKRTKSVDALEDKHSKRRSRRNRHMKHSKSKESVSSKADQKRHRRKHRSDSSASSDSDSDVSSDSDTGYSASVAAYSDQSSRRSSRRHRRSSGRGESSDKHRHHHHRHHRRRSGDDDKVDDKKQQKSKRDKDDYDVTPTLVPEQSAHQRQAPVGGVPVLPVASGGGISIPQHIVIPPQQRGAGGQPQRYHINSEITIRYNKDGSVVGGPTANQQQQYPSSSRPNIQPVSTTSASAPITAPSPQSTASTARVGGMGIRPGTAGHMDSSISETKGYVSTAV